MTHDDLERVNDYATKYNVHYHAIDEEAIYVPTETVGKYSIHESELVGMPIVHQLYKDIPTDKEFVKIMFVDEPEVLEELIPNLSDDFKSRYNIFRSAGFYLEVIHPEASKGKAVHHLADKLGLTRDEVMCLGDHENDRDMIEYAGLGVAMGNAIDSIKEIANFVTTTNDEDGVAVAVEKFVLKQGELVMLHEMTLFPKPYASIASGQKRLNFVFTMRSVNRFKLVITFDLPIPKMLRKRHCAKWFNYMSLKTLENCMKNSRYYNVGILQKTWRTHIPMTC